MIRLEGVCRSFVVDGGDDVVALDDVSFEMRPGRIYGVLGPNGAGKTTTLRIIATSLLPSTGVVRVFDHDAVNEPKAVRRLVSAVYGGDTGLYPRLSALDNLRFGAALRGLGRREGLDRSKELLSRVGLDPGEAREVGFYSRGMKQRVHLARGLLTEPSVLLFDEPTIGLDHTAANEFRQMLRELRAPQRVVVLTSHNLRDLEELCDELILIHHGRVRVNAPTATIVAGAPSASEITAQVTVTGTPDLLALGALDGVTEAELDDGDTVVRIRCEDPGALLDAVLRAVMEWATVGTVHSGAADLEKAYDALITSLDGDR